MNTRNMLLTLVFGAGICLSGCNLGDFGEVEQGRCVGVSADGKTVSVLLDTAKNPKAPEYTKVAEFAFPDDPKEMGPEPIPGNLVAIDLEKKVLKIFNPATKAVEDVKVEFTDSRKGVGSSDPAVKGKKFPVKADKGVTLYSEAQKILVTVKADGDRTYKGRYIFGCVTNTRSIAWLIKLYDKKVDLNDGMFEVMLVKEPKDPIDFSNIILGLSTTVQGNEMFDYFRASDLTFTMDKNAPWTVDGEEAKSDKVIHLTNMKEALTIYK